MNSNNKKLIRNARRLRKLENSSKVSYPTKTKMHLFTELVYNALLIYKKQLNTPEFDKDVEALNEFINAHIVIRNWHWTFRRVNSFEIDRKEYNKDNTLKTVSQKRAENVEKFQAMGKRFSNILAKENPTNANA